MKKKTYKTHIIVLTIAIAMLGCQESKKANNQNEREADAIEIIDEHTSEIALDWDGTYKGLLPCASCPGILTSININADKTFEKSNFYLESKNAYTIEKGSFSFTENGRDIILKPNVGSSAMYAVGENKLTMLNANGERMSSDFAKMYELTKMSNEELEFSNRPIKGLITFGHEVRTFEPCGSAKVYWIKDLPDAKLSKMYQDKTNSQSAPYTPMMAELVLKNIGKAHEGFAEQYDGVLELVEIISVEIVTANNYCEN